MTMPTLVQMIGIALVIIAGAAAQIGDARERPSDEPVDPAATAAL